MFHAVVHGSRAVRLAPQPTKGIRKSDFLRDRHRLGGFKRRFTGRLTGGGACSVKSFSLGVPSCAFLVVRRGIERVTLNGADDFAVRSEFGAVDEAGSVPELRA